MKFTITGCAPAVESVTAGLKIGLRVEASHFEALMGLRGLLLSSDNKIVTTLTTFAESNTPVNHPVAAHGSGSEARYNNETSTDTETQLLGFLNRQAIDYLETLRDRNPKKDIELKVKLKISILLSASTLATIDTIRQNEAGEMHEFVLWKYRPEYSTSNINQWLISGNSSPVFLQVQEKTKELSLLIKGNDWAHDFAPQLQLGKFLLVELPVLSNVEDSRFSRLRKAAELLLDIEAKIFAGEWPEAC